MGVYTSAHGLPSGVSGEEPICQCRRCKRHGFNPWVGKILWRRKWQPTALFLPGKSHRQKSLVGCSIWGLKCQAGLERTQHRGSDSAHDRNYPWEGVVRCSQKQHPPHVFFTPSLYCPRGTGLCTLASVMSRHSTAGGGEGRLLDLSQTRGHLEGVGQCLFSFPSQPPVPLFNGGRRGGREVCLISEEHKETR